MGSIEQASPVLRRITPKQAALVIEAGHLFDRRPQSEGTERFLESPTHHLVIAYVDELPVGFITGVELMHPDKGTEMMLYELGVAAAHRRRGIGTALVRALVELARDRSCYGMWVPTDAGDAIAAATYRAAGAGDPESAAILTWDFGSAVTPSRA